MGKQEFQLFYQRHLPHYQPPGATLFITYRLTGSLPKEVVLRLKEEIHAREIGIQNIKNLNDRKNAAISAWKKHFSNWDLELDKAGQSPKWLSEPKVAGVVCDALRHRDGYEYQLDAFCVMPNHVHIVCTPLQKGEEYYFLPKLLQSLKGYTAWEANKILNRKGQFWQHESYDHVIRDNDEFIRVVNYVLENPSRAGLAAQWTYVRDGIV